jgi:hypothetical protein
MTKLQISEITIYLTVQKNQKEHVDRMRTDRMQERFLKYQPEGRRSLRISP